MMVSLWCIIGLAIAAVSVSILGAAFSIFGLAQLFAGAVLPVALMASALEFAKFVIAAFLHQVWPRLNWLFKIYLATATVILSCITSMGIFGFLSNAYQLSSAKLEQEEIKLEALKGQQARNQLEIERINKAIDEVPASRITKKMKLREEMAPTLATLAKDSERIAQEIALSNLQILDVKQKVGPLIYISRAFKMDIDTVVKYLILVFVSVFDPLAICLVIAVSESFKQRRLYQMAQNSGAQQTSSQPLPPSTPAAPAEEDVIKMRFVDDEEVA